MDSESVHVAVDVGTTKVATLVGVVHPNGRLEIVGAGVVPSQGLAKGAIVNIPDAQEAIQASLEEAARASGQPIRRLYATVTGIHLEFTTRWGGIHSPHYSVPISYAEVDRAVETAYPAELPPERMVLHLVPRSYSVDGLKGVRNPIGMHALRLDVETLCVTAASVPVRNLVRAIEHSRVRVAGLIMAGLAAGEAVLTRDEREMGVLLLEMGGGVTTVAAFQQDTLAGAAVLPVGGVNCTNDLAVALSTPFDVAEQIKLQHGHLMPDAGQEDRVEIQSFGDGIGLKIERRELARYLRDRVEETLRMASLQAHTMGLASMPPAGVVITGGSAKLPGMQALARRTFNCPVRIGIPRLVEGLPDELADPGFASVVGSLLWGVHNQVYKLPKPGHNGKHHKTTTQADGVAHRNGHSLGGEIQAKAVAWLKERARRVAL